MDALRAPQQRAKRNESDVRKAETTRAGSAHLLCRACGDGGPASLETPDALVGAPCRPWMRFSSGISPPHLPPLSSPTSEAFSALFCATFFAKRFPHREDLRALSPPGVRMRTE